ncbi:MAG TPA: hypothetical protein VJ797_09870 [Burkholderiales bacterium]|nr:hypothetical protein [Burkholderiales bacterium]
MVQQALLVPWRRRSDFAWALAVPLALLAGLSLAWYFAEAMLRQVQGWWLFVLYWGVFAAFFTLFAVTCHRLVLVPSGRVRSIQSPRWSARESRFLFWVLTLWIVYLVVWWLAMLVSANLLPTDEVAGWLKVIESVASVPALYLIARLSLVFPATAIDRPAGLRWAWRTSRGNGWRLVVVVTVLPWLMSHLVGLLYRDEATAAEIVLLTVLGTALFALEIAALSVAYRELVRNEL